MITFKILLIFSFLISLKTTTAADTVVNATVSFITPSSSSVNTTSVTEVEADIIFACGTKPNPCQCYEEHVYCGDYSNPLKSLNIKFENSTIYQFKSAGIRVDVQVLKKGKIFPGSEHTFEKLDFDLSKIGSIEDGAFDKFIKLQTLSFMDCNISSFNNRIFTKAVGRTLNSLDLHYDGFVKLETNAFEYLTNLTTLNLNGNNMEAFLNVGMFPASLKKLNLGFCKISKLPDDIFSNLMNLETLSFNGNPLTTIPKAINPLQNLVYLSLDNTKITEITFGEIKPLKKLTKLSLTNVATLEYIDSFAFCSFPNLTTLDLSNNKNLKNIHENAFGSFIGHFVTNLQDLKIKNCNLTVLPESLLQWEKIKSVTISPNPFTCNCSMAWLINDFINPSPKYYKTFRGDLPRCSSPPELEGQTFQEISGTVCFERNTTIDNRIVVCHENDTSDALCKCSNHELSCSSLFSNDPSFLSLNLKIKDANYTLKKVSFAWYPIYTLKRGQIMRGHENTIEEIDLHYNKIEKIENRTFDDFTSLKILKITGNYLKAIDENILTENVGKTLTVLDLDDNYGGNILLTAFKHLKKLEKLSLNWNYGMTDTPLKKELFSKSLENLKSLTLKAYVTEFDDDLFDNLVNLEELYLNYGSLSSVPTALNALSNLQLLDIRGTDIVKFDTQNLTTVFDKLKILKMESMGELTTIGDCAFCLFPNLEELDLTFSSSLEVIHKNAFGYANVTTASNKTSVTKLQKFTARYCKLSTLPENLLPWDTVKEIRIDKNPFICDCSMAWLINDFAKNCSKYSHIFQYSYRLDLECAGPAELKGKSFKEISSKNCSTNFTTDATFKESKNCTLKLKKQQKEASKDYHYYRNTYYNYNSHSSSSVTLFVTVCVIIVIVGAVVFYFYRRKRYAAASMSVKQAVDKLNIDISMSQL